MQLITYSLPLTLKFALITTFLVRKRPILCSIEEWFICLRRNQLRHQRGEPLKKCERRHLWCIFFWATANSVKSIRVGWRPGLKLRLTRLSAHSATSGPYMRDFLESSTRRRWCVICDSNRYSVAKEEWRQNQDRVCRWLIWHLVNAKRRARLEQTESTGQWTGAFWVHLFTLVQIILPNWKSSFIHTAMQINLTNCE